MGHGLHKRITFLPMLCSRHCIKEVNLPKWDQHHSSSFSEEDDPNLSPRISCIGQIKRHNKVIAFPTSQKLTFTTKSTTKKYISNNNNNVKYSKLKKFFSAKNLDATTHTLPISSGFRSGRVPAIRRSSPENGCNSERCSVFVNIDEMDPPLPVIKKVQKPAQECEIESLWKRRHGVVGLKCLKLQQIQITRHQLQPTTCY